MEVVAMCAALGLLALALLGADGSPNGAARPVQFRVKLLEMDGLSWRETLYNKLQPVTRQETCTVWTCDREVAKTLAEKSARVLMSPQLMAEPGAVAHFSQKASRRVVSQLTRHADGPVDHAISAVAYAPDVEELREGCQFTMSGRQLDQGMLIKLVADDSRIAAVHRVKLTEFVPATDKQKPGETLNPHLEVPEVVRATLSGEWLIPKDGVILASLGAHTQNDGQGKAVVRERLLVVDAALLPLRTSVDMTQSANRVFTFAATARPSTIPMPMPMAVPAMPSRSLPQGRDSDGTPVPLPPLPESKVPPALIPGTSEPCATPQTLPRAGENEEHKTVDADSTKVKYEPESKPSAKPDSVEKLIWSLLKPYVLRVPTGTGVDLEIKASLAPSGKR
jgi:hypothetical protein